MEKLRVLDPTVTAMEEPLVFAPRPESLQNLRIGLVDNTKYNSDKLLLKIAALLEEKRGTRSHTLQKKRTAGVPAHEAIINVYKAHCDIVISGIGD
jgi:hypothetical protein